ncbi:hypothetical protein SCOR_21595 [Sulfidibacter corallicola]|uniref:Outer membrane protein beta-barrel domain-containing protein n=1 Tax=Sulfidibacter corallicola TaxID=2818388 RepID=A0A8A4TVF5_SULCO|nr:hypothetical protein [Sulfidibacter corallicola]QTD52972.1 hypothetical protein J3U87_10950 [Sulfidibacter corallicola]
MRSMRLILFLLCPAVWAQIGDASFTIKTGYADAYLFRGHNVHDDDVYQGEFGLGIARWSYNLNWTEAADETLGGFEREAAHNISFTSVLRNMVTTVGYQYLDYEGGLLDTQEIYMRFTQPGKWNPTYGIAVDVDAYKGYYADFALSRPYILTRRSQVIFTIKTALALDLDQKRNRENDRITEAGFYSDDGLVHSQASLTYFWQIHKRFKFELGGRYHYAHDDLLYDEEAGIDKDTFVGFASFRFTFP